MSTYVKHQDQVKTGRTEDLWRLFPWSEIVTDRDRNRGISIVEDFVSFDSAVDAAAATVRYGSGGQRIYVDASSTIAPVTGLLGGGLRIFATAVDEEAWIQWGGATGAPFSISDAIARDLALEVAFRCNVVDDDAFGFFIGLMEEGCAAADTIADAGTMASKDFVGFFRPEGDGDSLDWVYRKNGAAMQTKKAKILTLAANTWYKIGFRFSPSGLSVTPWHGIGTGATPMTEDKTNKITTANIAAVLFPDAQTMNLIAGLKCESAEDAYIDLRWAAVGQAL